MAAHPPQETSPSLEARPSLTQTSRPPSPLAAQECPLLTAAVQNNDIVGVNIVGTNQARIKVVRSVDAAKTSHRMVEKRRRDRSNDLVKELNRELRMPSSSTRSATLTSVLEACKLAKLRNLSTELPGNELLKKL